jgi:CubicO group peptidase (beta-lactamase class C family)
MTFDESALTVLALVARGTLELGTTARSVVGGDLPLVDDGVTVEHLLSHRSGIGGYLDEDLLEEVDDYVMRCRCTGSPRPRTTCRSSTGTRRCHRRGAVRVRQRGLRRARADH